MLNKKKVTNRSFLLFANWLTVKAHSLIKFVSFLEKIERTVQIEASTVEIEERGVKLRLTVVDTPGYGDAINCRDWYALPWDTAPIYICPNVFKFIVSMTDFTVWSNYVIKRDDLKHVNDVLNKQFHREWYFSQKAS